MHCTDKRGIVKGNTWFIPVHEQFETSVLLLFPIMNGTGQVFFSSGDYFGTNYIIEYDIPSEARIAEIFHLNTIRMCYFPFGQSRRNLSHYLLAAGTNQFYWKDRNYSKILHRKPGKKKGVLVSYHDARISIFGLFSEVTMKKPLFLPGMEIYTGTFRFSIWIGQEQPNISSCILAPIAGEGS